MDAAALGHERPFSFEDLIAIRTFFSIFYVHIYSYKYETRYNSGCLRSATAEGLKNNSLFDLAHVVSQGKMPIDT